LVSLLQPLPDPATLDQSISRSPQADPSEIAQLRKTIRELETEMSALKNQDLTVRRLEKKITEIGDQYASEKSVLESEWSRRLDVVRAESDQRLISMRDKISEVENEKEKLEFECKNFDKNLLQEKTNYDEIIRMKNIEIEELGRQLELATATAASAAASASTAAQSTTINMYKDIISQSEDRMSKLENEILSLQNQNTQLSNELSDSATKAQAALDAVNRTNQQLAEAHERMVSQLAEMMGPVGGDATTVIAHIQSTMAQKDELIEMEKKRSESALVYCNQLKSELDVLKEQLGALQQSQQQSMAAPVASATPQHGASDSVVSIIQVQRDKFRARVGELESERDELKQNQTDMTNRMNSMVMEMRRVEQEKQFWKSQKSGTASPGEDVEFGGSSASSPPVLFSKLRKAAANGNGADFEQTVTSLMVHGIGNPIIRRIGVVYLFTLHLLVFMVLYRLSSFVSSDSGQSG